MRIFGTSLIEKYEIFCRKKKSLYLGSCNLYRALFGRVSQFAGFGLFGPNDFELESLQLHLSWACVLLNQSSLPSLALTDLLIFIILRVSSLTTVIELHIALLLHHCPSSYLSLTVRNNVLPTYLRFLFCIVFNSPTPILLLRCALRCTHS